MKITRDLDVKISHERETYRRRPRVPSHWSLDQNPAVYILPFPQTYLKFKKISTVRARGKIIATGLALFKGVLNPLS